MYGLEWHYLWLHWSKNTLIGSPLQVKSSMFQECIDIVIHILYYCYSYPVYILCSYSSVHRQHARCLLLDSYSCNALHVYTDTDLWNTQATLHTALVFYYGVFHSETTILLDDDHFNGPQLPWNSTHCFLVGSTLSASSIPCNASSILAAL